MGTFDFPPPFDFSHNSLAYCFISAFQSFKCELLHIIRRRHFFPRFPAMFPFILGAMGSGLLCSRLTCCTVKTSWDSGCHVAVINGAVGPASMINECHMEPSTLVLIRDFNSSVWGGKVFLCFCVCVCFILLIRIKHKAHTASL